MIYIKLEDVQKILIKEKLEWEHSEFLSVVEEYVDDATEEINSLPSIDFEEMIQEMIEEMRNKEYTYDLDMVKIDALQELISKLPK